MWAAVDRRLIDFSLHAAFIIGDRSAGIGRRRKAAIFLFSQSEALYTHERVCVNLCVCMQLIYL